MTCGLLERVGQLQDAPLIAMPADDLQPDRQPVADSPAGTDVAGFDIIVTYQHDRVQSTHVAIGAPAIAVGYGVSTSNGST